MTNERGRWSGTLMLLVIALSSRHSDAQVKDQLGPAGQGKNQYGDTPRTSGGGPYWPSAQRQAQPVTECDKAKAFLIDFAQKRGKRVPNLDNASCDALMKLARQIGWRSDEDYAAEQKLESFLTREAAYWRGKEMMAQLLGQVKQHQARADADDRKQQQLMKEFVRQQFRKDDPIRPLAERMVENAFAPEEHRAMPDFEPARPSTPTAADLEADGKRPAGSDVVAAAESLQKIPGEACTQFLYRAMANAGLFVDGKVAIAMHMNAFAKLPEDQQLAMIQRGDFRAKGVVAALVGSGQGVEIDPSDLRKGDLMQVWYRANGKLTGHVGVVKDVLRDRAGGQRFSVIDQKETFSTTGRRYGIAFFAVRPYR